MRISGLICLLLSILSASPGAWAQADGKKVDCRYECINPHSTGEESDLVLATLQAIFRSVEQSDFTTFASYLDADACMFDEETNKLVTGRESIVNALKEHLEHAHIAEDQVVHFVIDEPYAHVDKDLAVVTFRARKEFAGKHPLAMESQCSNVFVRKDGQWKMISYRTRWKKVAHPGS